MEKEKFFTKPKGSILEKIREIGGAARMAIIVAAFSTFFDSCVNIDKGKGPDTRDLEKAKETFKNIVLSESTANEINKFVPVMKGLEGGTSEFTGLKEITELTNRSLIIDKDMLKQIAEEDGRLNSNDVENSQKVGTEIHTGNMANILTGFMGISGNKMDNLIQGPYGSHFKVLNDLGFNDNAWVALDKTVDDKIAYSSRFCFENDSSLYWISGRPYSVGTENQGNYSVLNMDPRSGIVKAYEEIDFPEYGDPNKEGFQIENGVIENVDAYNQFSKRKENLEKILEKDIEDARSLIETAKEK